MDQAGIKQRMVKRLEELRWDKRELAKATRDAEENVYRWLSYDEKNPEKNRVPADFLARYAKAIPVNLTWLLFGDGDPDPVEEGEAVKRLAEMKYLLLKPLGDPSDAE